MRIGIAQINTVAGQFDQTVDRMVAQSQRAAEQGVDLLVFPLAAFAGTDVVSLADRMSFMGDCAEALVALSGRLACPALVPFPLDFGDEAVFFEAVLIADGGLRPLRMLSVMSGWLGGEGEGGGQASETDITQFEFGGLRFAVTFSHQELDLLDDYDYDIDAVLFLSSYPYAMDDPSSPLGADLDKGRYVDDATMIGAWICGAGSLGCYGDEVFTGSSFVMAPSGKLAALAPACEEALLVADIEPTFSGQLLDAQRPEVFDAPFHAWQAVALGIHDYATKHGWSDVALLLDGSLASSVLAALASDALGPLHVHALVGISAGQAAPACRDLCRRLRIDRRDADVAPSGCDARTYDLVQLAAYGADHNALVLSSLDKSALALGSGLGDVRVAGLCPLGDVYRSDVLDMAHVRNTISPLFRRVELGDADVLAFRRSDGSAYEIGGEQEMTAVDELLLGFVEYDRPLAELVTDTPLDPELAADVLRALRESEPLRRLQPPVLAMSTHTLADLRIPLGVRWHDDHLEVMDEAAAMDLAASWGWDPERAVSPLAEEEGPQDDPGDHDSVTHEFDLEKTLAMLRDLAEQGGFMAGGPMPLGRGQAQGEAGQLGWMGPFSEN